MCGAICPNQSRPVHREPDGEILDRDVVYDLIVCALQEGRIDCTEGPMALCSQASGESYCMLLSDANVEHTFRKDLAELVQAGAGWHRRGDCDDRLVPLCFRDERLCQYRRV